MLSELHMEGMVWISPDFLGLPRPFSACAVWFYKSVSSATQTWVAIAYVFFLSKLTGIFCCL